MMVRRPKTIIKLEKRTDRVVECDLGPYERMLYDALESRVTAVVGFLKAIERQGCNLFSCYWVLLLRLRQGVLHSSAGRAHMIKIRDRL